MSHLPINRTDDDDNEFVFPEVAAICSSGLFGCSYQNFARALSKQLIDSVWTYGKVASEVAEARMGAIEAWLAMEPRDGFEAGAAALAVGALNAAMGCFQQGALETLPPLQREAALNLAIKLSDVYLREGAVVDKHRGKGQQKITVKRVTVVEAGGQAIVGNVERPAIAASDETVPLPVMSAETVPVPPIRVRSRTRRQ
jgi:hypothetical protein